MSFYKCDDCKCETTRIFVTKRDEQFCGNCIEKIHPLLRWEATFKISPDEPESLDLAFANVQFAFDQLKIAIIKEILPLLEKIKR